MACNTKNKRRKFNMDYEKTNSVLLSGTVSSSPVFSHELYGGEKFFNLVVDVQRLSGVVDSIPVTISEFLMASSKLNFDKGAPIEISGEFRSHNFEENGRSKLILSVFCKDVAERTDNLDVNQIELSGFVCKPPIFRETPFKRQINDILLAVNRPFFKKSDYIPLIAWGRNALFAKNFRVGDKVGIVGRIQSRRYNKVIDDVPYEKTAYEVSIQDITNYEEKIESHLNYDEPGLTF